MYLTLSSIILTGLPRAPLAKEITFIIEAKHLWETFKDMIWPDYDTDKIPLLLFDSKTRQWLINHPAPPADWVPVKHENDTFFTMAPHSKPGWYYFLTGSIWKINGHWTAIFATEAAWKREFGQEKNKDMLPADIWFVTVVIHEGFHVYQRQFFDVGNTLEAYNSEPPKDNQELMDLAKTTPNWRISTGEPQAPLVLREQKLLAEAFDTPDDNRCLEKIREFLRGRKHRFRDLDADTKSFEDFEELIEGTARYVDIRLCELLDKSYNPTEAMKSHPRFENYKGKEWQLKRFLNEGFEGNLTEVRFKITGGLICKLLERLGAEDWKKDIFLNFQKDHITLVDILEETISQKAKDQK